MSQTLFTVCWLPSAWRKSRRPALIAVLSLVLSGSWPGLANAQLDPLRGGRFTPLNQNSPVGQAARWAQQSGEVPPAFQPVRIRLPFAAKVTFYDQQPTQPIVGDAPAQVSLLTGCVYRCCISDIADRPGEAYWPTIELIDRLHPPPGREDDFPVDIELTAEELNWALAGRLITKVVYLEQPQRVPSDLLAAPQRVTDVDARQNAVAEADLLGRPVAIVRLGGRQPDTTRVDYEFFGPGGPVRRSAPRSSASPTLESRRRRGSSRTMVASESRPLRPVGKPTPSAADDVTAKD